MTLQIAFLAAAGVLALISIIMLVVGSRSGGSGGEKLTLWPPAFFHPRPSDTGFLEAKPVSSHAMQTMVSPSKKQNSGGSSLGDQPTPRDPIKLSDLQDTPTNQHPTMDRDAPTSKYPKADQDLPTSKIPRK